MENKSKNWIIYDIYTTTMLVNTGYAIDSVQSVKILKVSIKGSKKITCRAGYSALITQILN